MDKSMEDAFRYLDSELKSDPNADRTKLIEDASRRFDLNPMQTEFLIKKFIIER